MNENILVNKGGKSGERDDNVRFLAARIGNKTLVSKQGALCAGTFNSTQGVNVSSEVNSIHPIILIFLHYMISG